METPSTAPEVESAERTDDPVHKASYVFRREGENLWVYTWLGDGGHLPEHFHPPLEERWEVLDGAAEVKIDGSWRELRPEHGPAVIAPGVRHELKNSSGREIRLRAEVLPAGHLQEFLVETARGAREGLYNARNLPTSLRGALWIAKVANQHLDETVMCSPPPALQRLVVPLVARLAR